MDSRQVVEVQQQFDTLHTAALAACWLRDIAVDVPSGYLLTLLQMQLRAQQHTE
jgi:hypothetical protein